MKNPRFLSTALILLLLLTLPPALCALEIRIPSGLYTFSYLYASQMGKRGFFGPYDRDMSTKGGNLAPLNGWFQDGMVSGTTGVASWTRMVIFSVLELNKAVSVKGTYRIGPFSGGNLVDLWDADTLSLGSLRRELRSAGRWSRLWIEVDTPLGRVYYGKRYFRQGCGLQFGSGRIAEAIEESSLRSEEIFQLDAFAGPLTLGAGFYPWRRGSTWYWNPEDHNAERVAHVLGYARYTAGWVDMGMGGFFLTFNEGPEAGRTRSDRESLAPHTTTATEGWIYLKFNNGRLFFNAEADWYYHTIRRQGSLSGLFLPSPRGKPVEPVTPGGGGSRFAPSYIESWRYMSEFGFLSGPTKLTFLAVHIPGPDRRHGILIDKQPYVQEADKSAYGVFYPYCVLMATVYCAGVNSFRDMSASDVVAGMVNYMPASNLEVYASLMRAWRSSHGYSWGYVRPNPTASAFGRLDFGQRGSFTDPAPAIPDNDLGWEFNLGLTWKLLDRWQVRCRGAYWKPGGWFNYACVDKSVPNWDEPSSTNNFGVNPSRTIDPVLGFQLYLDATF